ncbi:MAG TPA: hypothetical protein PK402_03355, partial [Tepidisphaeraceae bacterium]|nr:hypothetical protein [Tepidisphaeraceae bacterium]
DAGKFGLTRELTARELALPDAVTTRLVIDDSQRKQPRNVELALHRLRDSSSNADQLQLLITIRDLVTVEDESVEAESSKPRTRLDLESALLDPIPIHERETIALASPSNLSGSNAKGLALLIEIEPASDSTSHEEAYARLVEEIRATDEANKSRMIGGSWPGFESALQGASKPETRRASLQFIANRTGAVIAIDLVLLANSDLLAAYTNKINEAISASSLDRKPELLGWLMDRVALEMLTKQLSDDTKMPGELRTILLRHAGEAGRDSATMSGVLRNLQSRQELATRLLAENLIALEDTSPATRVRAFDWLASIGKAPPKYDPLGPDNERKAALATIDQ